MPLTADIPDFNQQLGRVHPEFQSEVQKTLDLTRQEFGVVGATVAVVVRGKLVAALASGVRKIGTTTAIQVTDPMHLGSNTKGMTCLLAARLIEKKRIKWTTPLKSALPGLEKPMQPSYERLPLIELMYQRLQTAEPNVHLPRYTGVPVSEGRKRLAADFLSAEPTGPPGVRHEYHNANFITLGAALEIATQRSWEELMKTELFQPLRFQSAGFGPMGNGKDTSAPWQHPKNNGKFEPIYHDNPPVLGPAGRVHCNVLDLANYAYAHVDGALGGTRFLHHQTWATVQTPPSGSSYACGIATSPPGPNGVRDMSHGGSNNLSCSDWWVRNGGEIIVVSAINCQSPEGNLKILERVLELTRTWMKRPYNAGTTTTG